MFLTLIFLKIVIICSFEEKFIIFELRHHLLLIFIFSIHLTLHRDVARDKLLKRFF